MDSVKRPERRLGQSTRRLHHRRTDADLADARKQKVGSHHAGRVFSKYSPAGFDDEEHAGDQRR